MINFWSILMFLVLLKPVSRAEFKYVCIVWIGNQIREIFTADSIRHKESESENDRLGVKVKHLFDSPLATQHPKYLHHSPPTH